MGYELICTWLGLPPGEWPPDHYRLLDLEPSEADADRIERQVHQRLEVVRRYQLLHPELVTEAMNRLAQAYVCLTDPEARRAYDAGRPSRPAGAPPPSPSSPPRNTPLPPPVMVAPLPVSEPSRAKPAPPTLSAPELPPLVLPTIPVVPATVVAEAPAGLAEGAAATGTAVLPEGGPAAVPAEAPAKVDPAVEAARASREARRGLGTKRALYRRLAATRRLQRAWDAAGKYLANPKRRLARPAEATELIAQLQAVAEALQSFPRMLGEAGQPGYSVVVLARQAAPVPIFQTLLPSQREVLAQHWKSGRQLLQAHREYLRQEVAALRKKGPLGRAYRAARAAITDQPGALLLLLALIALNIAIWRQLVLSDWLEESSPPPPPAERR